MIDNDTPIYNTLQDFLSKSPIRMHVPFHNGFSNNKIIPDEVYNLDISEVSGYDTDGEKNPIFQSEKITANYFGVSHSFYLTGGASAGLLASLIALNKYGKKVILARNVHKSVINGVILAGLTPIWLEVDFLPQWGVFNGVNHESLKKLISENNDICGCVIVSPTYEGMISDIKLIADICHKSKIPLIVDEAHGGHLYFLNEHDLKSAVQVGADIVIQSWHKSLGSLTQSGILHLVNDSFFDYYDLKRSLDLVNSTSPSFLLLLSLELTRQNIFCNGKYIFNQLLNKAQSLKLAINNMKDFLLLENHDPLKIYSKHKKVSGIDFAYDLYKKFSIEIESANEKGFLILVGNDFNDDIAGKIKNSIQNLEIKSVGRDVINHASVSVPMHSDMGMAPREAFMLGYIKRDPEIHCDIYAPCPPGYALKVPGSKRCN